MALYTTEQLEQMDTRQLNKLGKQHGLKVGKLSPFQIKSALLEITEVNVNTDSQENTVMAAKKNVSKKSKSKKPAKTERKARTGTKAEKAREIFNENKNAERKVVLALFMKAGLSKAGASTYYQNIKKKMSK